MKELILDGTLVSDNSDCYVIAEIGNNHQGSPEIAKKMIRKAKLCGANAVKFQKRDNQDLFTKELYHAPYDNRNSFGSTYGAHREALEFGLEAYLALIAYAREMEITLFATPFDEPSADFLQSLDMPLYKIASGDLTNIPLVKHVAAFGKPLIISTGGATMEDVQRVYDAVRPINDQIALLQCTSGYPARFGELDLRVIETYRKEFPEAVIGLSSHDEGNAMPVAAYALGARIVEKHFTLDRTLMGTDHVFSLEPRAFQEMVKNLKNVRQALGSSRKRFHESERKPLVKMCKKLVAAGKMPAGHVLTASDIAIRCPGDGTPPFAFDAFVGMALVRDLDRDDPLSFDDVVKP